MVIEAVKWDGKLLEGIYPITFFKEHTVEWHYNQQHNLVIETLEGEMMCMPGDYLIKGIKGEWYPCKSEIFKATYEEVDEQQ